jgi:aspartate-semialdehyde dehydrogenase
LDELAVREATVVILAGAAATHQRAYDIVRQSPAQGRPALVDATGALTDLPEARLCAPVLEHMPPAAESIVYVPAHPVAVALVRLLKALREAEPADVLATVFEPASERGTAGMEELQKQVINLFNFQALPTAVFDAQVAFNLLPRFGEDADVALASVQRHIEDALGSLGGPLGLKPPSIRVVQASVFHSYTLSVWLRFEKAAPETAVISAALEAQGFEVRGGDTEPGSNSGVASQSGVTISDIAVDRTNPHVCWLWMAFDNLRARADNTLLTAALLSRGAGK